MKKVLPFIILALVASGCQKTRTIFVDSFDSYVLGKSIHNQGEWRSENEYGIPLNQSFQLKGGAVDGFNSLSKDRRISRIYRPIGLEKDRIHILSFDAYAKSEGGETHNSGVNLTDAKNKPIIGWVYVNDAPKEKPAWKFKSPGIPDFIIPLGPDLTYNLKIILDPFNKMCYGQIICNGKTIVTDYRELTPEQFSQITRFSMFVDYKRFPKKSGLQFDNISLLISPQESIHRNLRKVY